LTCTVTGEEEMAAGVMTTLASAMAAPEGSVTWPRKVPVADGVAAACGGAAAVWAAAAGAHSRNDNDKEISAKQKHVRNFIPSFHSTKSLRYESLMPR
jgi:hypothetical protein